MATDRYELVPEAILEQDGLKVSKSPWGDDDEIGRLNWITPGDERGRSSSTWTARTSST